MAARYFDLPSAMVARSYLESNGLFAVTPDYNFGSVNWHMTFALSGMRVMVREEDLTAAQELLNQNPENGWEICPSCGSDRIYRGKSLLYCAISILTFLLAQAPTAFVKNTVRRRCLICDHKWKDEMVAEPDTALTPLLLVGSIPLADTDAVLDAVADTIGPRLTSVPDGETGVRSNWIGWQHAVFATEDALEQGAKKEREYQLNPPYRFAPGKSAADIDFGELGFAREAINSYQVFAARRAAGQFSADARFQVCLPTPFAPVFSFCAYDIQGDIYPVYERAMMMEIDEIRLAIPDRDLAIQWDVATEMSIFEDLHPVPFLGDDPAPWLVETLARLGNAVPDGVTLGYHLCYGSMGNKHWKEPEDLGICVSTANAISNGVTRKIDFFHVPVPVDRDDDLYFAPLDTLAIGVDMLMYLGLIHGADGAEGAVRRIAAAQKHLDRFGLSTECGWGRMDTDEVVPLLELHGQL
jgi:hypothetical protein